MDVMRKAHGAVAKSFMGYRAQGIGTNTALQLVYLELQVSNILRGEVTPIAAPAIVPDEGGPMATEFAKLVAEEN